MVISQRVANGGVGLWKKLIVHDDLCILCANIRLDLLLFFWLEKDLAKVLSVNLLHHLSNGGEVGIEGVIILCCVLLYWTLAHKVFLAINLHHIICKIFRL